MTIPPPTDTTSTDTVNLSWTPPGTRVDGSSIALSEIDGYRINYGQSSDSLNQTIEVPAGTTEARIEGLAAGTWYFTIQVIDTSGLSSEPSDPVQYSVR